MYDMPIAMAGEVFPFVIILDQIWAHLESFFQHGDTWFLWDFLSFLCRILGHTSGMAEGTG